MSTPFTVQTVIHGTTTVYRVTASRPIAVCKTYEDAEAIAYALNDFAMIPQPPSFVRVCATTIVCQSVPAPVYAEITYPPTTMQTMHAWCLECAINDDDAENIIDATDAQIVAWVSSRYAGGVSQCIQDSFPTPLHTPSFDPNFTGPNQIFDNVR